MMKYIVISIISIKQPQINSKNTIKLDFLTKNIKQRRREMYSFFLKK